MEKINVTISIECEGGILTAEQARAIATDWENKELATARNIILENIKSVAEVGGLACSVIIKSGRPDYFYQSLEKQIRSLGYEVKFHPSDRNGGYWHFYW